MPVVLVFTKFDVVVSQILAEIAGGDAQYHGRARAMAHTMLEGSCRRRFHKELGDVPAEIVSGTFFLILLEGSSDILIVLRESKIH